ncbi:MAG: hypothetical protein ACYS9X_19580 [Planctomycetota bacterium]|jgi:hypothetical protein
MTARRSLAAAAFAALACAGASALEEVDERRAWESLHAGVTFTFDKTPMREAVAYFQGLGVNIVVEQDLLEQGDRPVTMRLANVRVLHAIRAMAASLELDCAVLEGSIVILRKPPPGGGESVGKITLKAGPQTLELDVKRRDLPSEARGHLMHRTVDVFRREAEERAHGLERRRQEAQREEHRRRGREEGERNRGEQEERRREGEGRPRERDEGGHEHDRRGDGGPGRVF